MQQQRPHQLPTFYAEIHVNISARLVTLSVDSVLFGFQIFCGSYVCVFVSVVLMWFVSVFLFFACDIFWEICSVLACG